MTDPVQQILYLYIGGVFVAIVLAIMFFSIKTGQRKRKMLHDDEVVKALLNEMREQRHRELQQMGAFNHPQPNKGKVINVDFTEAIIDIEEVTEECAKPVLQYRLIYDSVLGIYRKVPR
jgi:hypothetical protein